MLPLLTLLLVSVAQCAEEPNNLFAARVTRGQTHGTHLNHITGMSASRLHDNILWMVTSRDTEASLYATDIMSGNLVAWFNVTGQQGYDWEDMDYGPCHDRCNGPSCDTQSYCIYIGDIGNHGRDGAHDTVLMLREPQSIGPRNGSVYTGQVSVADTASFTWSEPDAETLMVGSDGRVYVVSKIDNGRAMLAEVPQSGWGGHVANINESNTAILKLLTDHHDPQGGSISPGGNEMLLVGEEGCWYYSIQGGDVIGSVNSQLPQKVSSYVAVDDAEAITWSADGGGFYTFSVAKDQFIYYYNRRDGSTVIG